MCGRFPGIRDLERVRAHYGATLREIPDDWMPNANTAPTHWVPVLRQEEANGRVMALVQWGWRPPWKPSGLINAQAETAPDKRTFAAAFRQRRCIVPTAGFFEWSRLRPPLKTPVHFVVQATAPCSLAGLWSVEQEDGEAVPRFIILTTAPNALVATAHDRMPLILDDAGVAQWLDPTASEDALRRLCRPYPAEAMRAWTIDPAIGNVRNNHADLLVPRGPWPPLD